MVATEKSAGEGAVNGSASGEAAEGIGAQLLKGARRDNAFAPLEVAEVKAQVEAVRGEAREMRGEMDALKVTAAHRRASTTSSWRSPQSRAAARRRAARSVRIAAPSQNSPRNIYFEIAGDPKVTIVGLPTTSQQVPPREESPGKEGEMAVAGEGGMAGAAAGTEPKLSVGGSAAEGKEDKAESENTAEGESEEEWGANGEDFDAEAELLSFILKYCCGTDWCLAAPFTAPLAAPVAAPLAAPLAAPFAGPLAAPHGAPIAAPCSSLCRSPCCSSAAPWLQALLTLWSRVSSGETRMDLSDDYLTDAALTQLTSFHSLT
ncbi:unnamed protein product [Closterium sp. Naga37s-1]|nr:unnamed protein product [Closterium sp. Naga37s-1]